MVGILLSYWDGLFSGALAVSFREGNLIYLESGSTINHPMWLQSLPPTLPGRTFASGRIKPSSLRRILTTDTFGSRHMSGGEQKLIKHLNLYVNQNISSSISGNVTSNMINQNVFSNPRLGTLTLSHSKIETALMHSISERYPWII